MMRREINRIINKKRNKKEEKAEREKEKIKQKRKNYRIFIFLALTQACYIYMLYFIFLSIYCRMLILKSSQSL